MLVVLVRDYRVATDPLSRKGCSGRRAGVWMRSARRAAGCSLPAISLVSCRAAFKIISVSSNHSIALQLLCSAALRRCSKPLACPTRPVGNQVLQHTSALWRAHGVRRGLPTGVVHAALTGVDIGCGCPGGCTAGAGLTPACCCCCCICTGGWPAAADALLFAGRCTGVH